LRRDTEPFSRSFKNLAAALRKTRQQKESARKRFLKDRADRLRMARFVGSASLITSPWKRFPDCETPFHHSGKPFHHYERRFRVLKLLPMVIERRPGIVAGRSILAKDRPMIAEPVFAMLKCRSMV
jgi:hypothetical protein